MRIEAEKLGDKTVIHNYGHGGAGISLSWGSAAEAIKITHEDIAPNAGETIRDHWCRGYGPERRPISSSTKATKFEFMLMPSMGPLRPLPLDCGIPLVLKSQKADLKESNLEGKTILI